MPSFAARWMTVTAATAAASLVSVLWIDRPLVLALHQHHLTVAILADGALSAPVMIVLAAGAVLTGLAFQLRAKPLPCWAETCLVAGLAVAISFSLIKFGLKPLFGRAIPSQLLADGTFGFFWLQADARLASFPSGHSAQAAAITTTLACYYPRLRWLCAAAFTLLAISLVLGEWHFPGDILAGGWLGASISLGLQHYWRQRDLNTLFA